MQLTHRLTFSAGSESHSKEHSSALTNRLFPWPLPGSNMHHSTLFFSLYHFFFCYYVGSVKQRWLNKQANLCFCHLKTIQEQIYTIFFKLKGSEFVVWCWCLLLPGLYYYRRLSDQSFKACCFPFFCVPGITSNLVLPYHQPTTLRTKLFSHLQIICQLSRSPLYTHLKVYNHRTNWGTMAVFLQRNESICLLDTKHSTKLKISNFSILIFSNNNK